MTERPQTRYVDSGGYDLAYQVVGEGGPDVVWVGGFASNVDMMWDVPVVAAFMGDLTSWARLVTFDKRGTGQSERVPAGQMPTLEQRLDELTAVQDAAECDRVALVGDCEGGALAALYTATFPERVSHLVLSGAIVSPIDDALRERVFEEWGTGVSGEYWAPSLIDRPGVREGWSLWERSSVTPSGVRMLFEMAAETDVRGVLPAVSVPTLIIHREGDLVAPVEHAREAAELIGSCELRILPGVDHSPWFGDAAGILRELRRFLTGEAAPSQVDRVLTTVLFTDLVKSTELAASLGDAAWRGRLELHDRVVARAVADHGGRLVKHTGDGIVATFDRPSSAIGCAHTVVREVSRIGLAVRCGVHTGECELHGEDLGGIAVHIAARVMGLAEPDDVLVTNTVRDLVAGSGIEFLERGSHHLKGVPDEWGLFAAT